MPATHKTTLAMPNRKVAFNRSGPQQIRRLTYQRNGSLASSASRCGRVKWRCPPETEGSRSLEGLTPKAVLGIRYRAPLVPGPDWKVAVTSSPVKSDRCTRHSAGRLR